MVMPVALDIMAVVRSTQAVAITVADSTGAEVPTAEAEASTAEALMAEVSTAGVAPPVASVVEGIPTEAIEAVGEPDQSTAVTTGMAATTEGVADIRRPGAVSVLEPEEVGRRRPEVLATLRRDGIRLEDQAMEV